MNAHTKPPAAAILPVDDLSAPMAAAEVKAARLALGCKTQQQLADALGLEGKWSKDTVRSWESGRVPISGPSRLAIRMMLKERGLLPDSARPASAAADTAASG